MEIWEAQDDERGRLRTARPSSLGGFKPDANHGYLSNLLRRDRMNTRQIRERLRSAPACAPNTVGERFDRGWKTAWAVFLLWAATAIASPAQTFTTLANFNGANADPVGTLAQGSDGNFYGTTFGDQETGFAGTVFKMTPTGTLTTLYGFCSQGGCVDGAAPWPG